MLAGITFAAPSAIVNPAESIFSALIFKLLKRLPVQKAMGSPRSRRAPRLPNIRKLSHPIGNSRQFCLSGMFLDWVGILLLNTVPIFVPILISLEFNGVLGAAGVEPSDIPLWYGVIFIVNMQMAFLSPPFGYSLFYLKSVAPPQISMATIFRSAMPFIMLQAIGVGYA